MNSRCIHGNYRVGICVPCCERRDAFAAAALTGLLANHARVGGTFREVANAARDMADQQIAALDAPKRDPLDQALNEGDGSYRP